MYTLGLIVGLAVHASDVQDRDGAEEALVDITGRFQRLRTLWAGGGYGGEWVHSVKHWYGLTPAIVKQADPHRFAVLPKRWIVERTFAWLGRYQWLSKNNESDPRCSGAVFRLAMINHMLHRLKRR